MFGLTYASIQCSASTTLQDFSNGLLIDTPIKSPGTSKVRSKLGAFFPVWMIRIEIEIPLLLQVDGEITQWLLLLCYIVFITCIHCMLLTFSNPLNFLGSEIFLTKFRTVLLSDEFLPIDLIDLSRKIVKLLKCSSWRILTKPYIKCKCRLWR